jgi:hypothetical protein
MVGFFILRNWGFLSGAAAHRGAVPQNKKIGVVF